MFQTQKTEENDYIFIKAGCKYHKVGYNSILFLKACGDFVKIFSSDTKILSSHTMKTMEDLLQKNIFTRVHRSYIISLDKIKSTMGNMVQIPEHEIPVGKSYRSSFFESVNKKNI